MSDVRSDDKLLYFNATDFPGDAFGLSNCLWNYSYNALGVGHPSGNRDDRRRMFKRPTIFLRHLQRKARIAVLQFTATTSVLQVELPSLQALVTT
jgi:hypothetical protein